MTGAPQSAEARRAVASYTAYADAQRAVDFLADSGFPVHRVAIVARGLSVVEQVTGRRTWSLAAGQGALQGAVAGLLFGFVFGAFGVVRPLVGGGSLALSGLLYGAVIGAALGLVGYAVTGGRRDFTSVGGLRAERYEVMADLEVAAEAERALGGLR